MLRNIVALSLILFNIFLADLPYSPLENRYTNMLTHLMREGYEYLLRRLFAIYERGIFTLSVLLD